MRLGVEGGGGKSHQLGLPWEGLEGGGVRKGVGRDGGDGGGGGGE